MTEVNFSWYVGVGTRNEMFNFSTLNHLVVDAGAGNDAVFLFNNVGNLVRGGAGDDVIISSDGGSSEPFGETLYGDLTGDPNDLTGGADQIQGSSRQDSIFGGGGGDFLYGYRGNDTADGGAGDDFVWGGRGADTLAGGLGNDTLFGQGDAFYPSFATITVDFDGKDDTPLSAGSSQRGPWGIAIGQAFSGEGDDGFGDRLDGGDGDDALYGQGGVDTLTGGAGFDALYGGTEDDSLDGGDGSDQLFGGAGFDTLVGGLSGDNLDGGAENDTLDAGDGDDNLDGGDGDDSMYGGLGSDSFYGGVGADTIDGGGGIDTLDYSFTNQNLVLTLTGATPSIVTVGGAAEDTITNIENVNGGQGNDRLTGDGGANQLYGDSGKDTLTGGGGADQLDGGLGKDKFVYGAVSDSTSTQYDTVTAFDARSEHFVFPVAVAGIDATVATGTLNDASFDADLHFAVKASKLAASNAVLFTPILGDHAGETFLIVDANGIAGYQGGKDYVIALNGAVHLSQLDAGDFSTSARVHSVLTVHPDGSAGVQNGEHHFGLGGHSHLDSAFA